MLRDWNIRKNLSSDEWPYVLSEIRKREVNKKLSEVTLYNKVITTEQIRKAQSRYSISELRDMYQISKLCKMMLNRYCIANMLQNQSAILHREFLFIPHAKNRCSISMRHHYFYQQLQISQNVNHPRKLNQPVALSPKKNLG